MFGRGDEPVMGVESRGLVVDGVDNHQPSGSSLPGGNRLAEGLRKQERAVTLALVEAVDGEAGEQDHADGIRGHRPDQPRRRVGTSNRAHGEAEVADDTVISDEDECPGGVHVLGRQTMAADPAVESALARGEGGDVVLGAEAFEPKTLSDQSPGSFGFERNNSVSSATGSGGRSSSAMKRSNASLDRTTS